MRMAAPHDGGKARISAAAIELFGRKGYDATTIRDIAETAEMSVGALYRHYANKDDLGRALYAEAIALWSERLLECAAGLRDPASRLRAMARFFCRAFDKDPNLFAFLLLNQHGPARSFDPKAANPVRILEAEIKRGEEDGRIVPGNRRLRALCVLGAVLQPAASYSRTGKTGLGALADEIADAAVRAAGVIESTKESGADIP
jgi:AcrR family transcriptional regulator